MKLIQFISILLGFSAWCTDKSFSIDGYHYPALTQEEKEAYIENVFRSKKEVFYYQKLEDLFYIIRRQNGELIANKVYTFEKIEGELLFDESIDRVNSKSVQQGLLVPRTFIDSLKVETIKEVYEYMRKKCGVVNKYYKKFDSITEFSQWMIKHNVDEKINIFKTQKNGEISIELNAYNWKLFPLVSRKEFVDEVYSSEYLWKKSVNVSLSVTIDNYIEIAKRYSGEKSPDVLIRYLAWRLRKSKLKKIIIPLENLLGSFIRRNINRYISFHGPNCYNSGLCINGGRSYKQEYTSGSSLKKAINDNYNLIEPNEKVRVGDLFLYYDSQNNIKHVSTFIANDIHFTKNGYQKHSPYIFQKYSMIEEYYFKKSAYNLRVFRFDKNKKTSSINIFSEGKFYLKSKKKNKVSIAREVILEKWMNFWTENSESFCNNHLSP